MAKYNKDGKFSDYYRLAERLNACGDALTFLSQFKDMTNEEMTKALESSDVSEGWVQWMLVTTAREIDEPLRHRCLKKIKTPMVAFQLYLTCEWLTAEEDAILESVFKGKLPTAEQELKDGIVKRVKSV